MRISRQAPVPIAFPVLMMTMLMPVMVVMMCVAQGLERSPDCRNGSAQLLQHRAYAIVAQDENTAGRYGRSHMPAAQMPGKFCQMCPVARPNFQQLLLGCFDFDLASVLENQPVAYGQQSGFCEIREDLPATGQHQGAAAQPALAMRQRDAVCGLGADPVVTPAQNRCHARELGKIGLDIEFHGALRDRPNVTFIFIITILQWPFGPAKSPAAEQKTAAGGRS